MSKAEIIKNNGSGSYKCEIIYDNRTDIEKELSLIDGKINLAYVSYLVAWEDAEDTQDEINIVKARIEYIESQIEIYEKIFDETWKLTIDEDLSPAQLAEKNSIKLLISQYQNELELKRKELTQLSKDKLYQESAFHTKKVDWVTYKSRKEELQHFPENPEEDIWCADLSQNYKAGDEVGIIPIAGDAHYNGWNIQPGYENNAVYDESRDGKLHHACTGNNLVWTYLNYLAFQAGVQRWMPSTRYARIMAIEDPIYLTYHEVDIDADKQFYISYQPAFGRWLKTDVNPYPQDQHNVPAQYMNCNHSAFSVGDIVLVEFQDRVTGLLPKKEFDGWDKPLIIGFKDNPQPCPNFLFYMGDPIVCKNNLGDVTDDDDCAKYETSKYYRVFDIKENFTTNENLTDADNSGLALNVICKPHLDSEQCGHGMYDCYDYDSITYDLWTVHAISWKVIQAGGRVLWNWAVAVDYAGAHWKFTYRDEEYDTWPSDPFVDRIGAARIEFGSYNPVHAFDLWLIESDEEVAYTGWAKGDFVLSICGKSNQLEIWNLTQELYMKVVININAAVLDDFPPQGNVVAFQEYHQIVSLGVKKLDVFFTFAFMKDEKMKSYAAVYKHDSMLGTCVNMDIEAGHTVVYNPFLQAIWFINYGEISSTGSDNEYQSWDYYRHTICNTPSGYPNPCISECREVMSYGNVVGWIGSGSNIRSTWQDMVPATGTTYTGYLEGEKTLQAQVYYNTAIATIQTCTGIWGAQASSGMTCDVYKNWIKDMGLPDAVSITGEGSGEKRTVNLLTGSDSCDDIYGALDTVEKTFANGAYDNSYGVENWPYMAAYSFVKHAYDSSGVEYENIVIQKNTDDEIEYVAESDQEIFFTLNTSYDHATS